VNHLSIIANSLIASIKLAVSSGECGLNRLNAGFTITQPAHNYRGGAPNTSYQIIINDTSVQLGDAATPLDQASFKNTLSSGDRGSLALAFFFAQLECDPDRGSKIVVFDDPFTSLDAFRRSQTVNQIVRFAPASTQVIVLSHEPYFLKLVWDRAAALDRKTLQMARAGKRNTNIIEWDINEALQDSYIIDFNDLRRYYDDAEGDGRDVVKKIRPVLEGYCRRVCRGEFAENDALGAMIEKIRDAGEAHHLASILADLEDINDFSRRHHHAGTVAGQNPVPDGNELQHIVGMTLDIVGGGL
jgi:wobble nucleotide-excising tRNase